MAVATGTIRQGFEASESRLAPLASAEQLFDLGPERLLGAFRLMWTIRRFEEKVEELYGLGRVHGTMHLSIGQEAVAAGWSLALRPDDCMLSHHRGHGHTLAKGAELTPMMAELLGKETGYCRGRGGSMHIADVSRNNLGANGIVAGGVPVATGLGISIHMQKQPLVVLSIFGDGAVNQGPFHEAVNLAAIWNLPVIYLCENNQYAMSMPATRAMRVLPAERAAAYGIPSQRVDGNDISAVYGAITSAAEQARSGSGPALVEAVTYRYRGHSKSDRNVYRTRDEIEQWRSTKDPIARFEKVLVERRLLDDEQAAKVSAEAKEAVEAAVKEAEQAPDPTCEDLLEGVYAP
jgi:TPP-dependent pyruvate/acetoin dehydrogenase alpha subunit